MGLRYFASGAMLAVSAMLTACGGGGSGGGSETALSVAVKVNGNDVQANNGRYTVKPGDSVAVTSNLTVTWTTTAAPASTTAPRTPTATSTSWTAQVANLSATAATLTLNASADASRTRDLVFDVAAGDARNGSYKVFATNGSRQALTLDFNNMAYTMTDDNNVSVSDVLTVDPTDSTAYVFKNTRVATTAANSRFRTTTDTVVGAFPFYQPKVLTSYAVQPFVASRAPVTTQASLDGAYTRLGINGMQGTTAGDSNIRQIRISNGGTLLQICNDVGITSIAACSTTPVDYTVSPGPTPDLWKSANVADPANDWGYFSIVKVAGQNVYLSAGQGLTASDNASFRIGFAESATWPNLSAIGGDTTGSWGTMLYTASTYDTTMTRADGTSYTYASVGLTSSSASFANLKGFAVGGASYFTALNGTLAAVVGARNGTATGKIQIGLVR